MLRALRYHGAVNLAVIAGATVATAVLTGALIVGDSVRGSLRVLSLDRLGGVHSALVAGRFFREELARELPGTAPAILLRGAASHADRRASRVAIHGVERRFFEVFGVPDPFANAAPGRGMFPPAVIGETLARELGVATGEEIVLRLPRASAIPRDSLMGNADPEAVAGALRVTVATIVPDRGLGRFALAPSQQVPRNAFVALDRLQRALGSPGEANALLAGAALAEPDRALAAGIRLEDHGLTLVPRDSFVELGARAFVLAPEIVRAAVEVAAALGEPAQPVQAYLANRVAVGERSIPYALVTALDLEPAVPWASLDLVSGGSAAPLGSDEILLNSWTATELGARVGDEVALTYYVVGPREELREETVTLEVAGIVEIAGLGADRTLIPDYPGIRNTRDIAQWDPPFPVDLSVIRPADEAYWDEHGATPKAFVSAATGERLWANRHGHTTSVRLGAAGQSAEEPAPAFRAALTERLTPAASGLAFEPVREQGLAAARGATDFGQLFLAFSVFLIASAALLVGLLFRLGVERRAAEIGLLLAVGYRVRTVRARLVAEGAVLAAAGGLLGLAGGAGYAALMMRGLRTLWRPAVGSSELYLHLVPSSLVLGATISFVVVLVAIATAVRTLVRVPPARLLAGAVRESTRVAAGRGPRVLALTAAAAAVLFVAASLVTGKEASPTLAFGSGTLVLVAGLAGFACWCRGRPRRPLATGYRGLAAMAARSSAWIPARSIAGVALVACATFVIGVVAASRGASDVPLAARTSGAGGFALVAESDVPLYHDLGRAEGRRELGFAQGQQPDPFDGVEVHPFRLRAGDDASCLNLYRPRAPRLVGVTERFVARGGFTFSSHAVLPEGVTDPWRLVDLALEPGVVPAIADAGSAQWVLHLGLGDELEIEDERGRPLRLRLVGLLERSVFQSELAVAESSLLAHFPSVAGDSWFLIEAPAERAAALTDILESVLDPFGFDVRPTAERLAGFRAVEHTYMATFQLLGGLGLVLGTLGLGVVLVRNVVERRGELATLRAFGYRRGLLAALVIAENAFLLLVGLGVGTTAALAAAAPRLVHVPWAALAAMVGLVVVTGMLASGFAVAGALRVPLLPSLKSERR